MGKEEKKAQTNATSPKNASQAGRAEREPSGPPAKEPEAAMKKKKAKRDPKAGQEDEDAHTCWGCRFPLLVAFLQLAFGASVTVLGFLMAGISSSLLVRDTPYWAGIIVSITGLLLPFEAPLPTGMHSLHAMAHLRLTNCMLYYTRVCVVALLGLVMLCVSYQPDEKTCIQFAIKVAYFLLSALSLIVCVLAVAFAAYRYSQITHFTCETILETCQCKLDTVDPLSRTFLFQSVLDCGDITGTFSHYLLIQIVLNLLAAIVGFVACFVMWKDRYQVFYVGTWLHSLTSTGIQQQKV